MIDRDIYLWLAGGKNGHASASAKSLADSSKDLLNEALSSSRTAIEFDSVETSLTGQGLPDWINPLRFEDNFNRALDALADCESLIFERRNALIGRFQVITNYRALPQDGEPHSLGSELEYIEEELKALDSDLEIRIVKRFLDLVEYSKAAKFGAKFLFGISIDDSSQEGGSEGVAVFRETLRELVKRYEVINYKDQETIIPISFKKAVTNSGDYLVKVFHKEPEYRLPYQGLTETSIEINLEEIAALSELRSVRIRRIGFQIIGYGNLAEKTRGKPPENLLHPDIFSIRLSDDSGGMLLGGSSDSASYKPGDIIFGNVPSSTDHSAILWDGSGELVNYDPRRKWRIRISDKSHLQSGLGRVRDLIMYIHVAHQGRM